MRRSSTVCTPIIPSQVNFGLVMSATLHYSCIVAWPTDWLASATALEAISTRSPLSLLCEAPIII